MITILSLYYFSYINSTSFIWKNVEIGHLLPLLRTRDIRYRLGQGSNLIQQATFIQVVICCLSCFHHVSTHVPIHRKTYGHIHTTSWNHIIQKQWKGITLHIFMASLWCSFVDGFALHCCFTLFSKVSFCFSNIFVL